MMPPYATPPSRLLHTHGYPQITQSTCTFTCERPHRMTADTAGVDNKPAMQQWGQAITSEFACNVSKQAAPTVLSDPNTAYTIRKRDLDDYLDRFLHPKPAAAGSG